MNVHSNKTSTASRAQGQCGASVVAENIEPDRQFNRIADRASGDSHRGERFRTDRAFREGYVAEIFDEQRIGTAAFVSARVIHSEPDNLLEITTPAWRTRQRTQMHDADKELARKFYGHRHGYF